MPDVISFLFHEQSTEIRPSDAAGHVTDLSAPTGLSLPTVESTGSAFVRHFDGTVGLSGALTSSTALLRRDVSVQALVELDVMAQFASGSPGIVAAHADAWQLFVEVIDPAARQVRLRLWWDSLASPSAEDGGAVAELPRGLVLLTATRRWLSDSKLRHRYYVNDHLLGEVLSPLADVAGRAADPLTVGCRGDGAGSYEYLLTGDIEHVRITNTEMTAEEVRQVYLARSLHRELAGDAIRASLPPGRAYSTDPDSGIQRELAVEGDALGMALGKLAELREDLSPERAWSLLEDWERVTGLPPKLLDTTETRRSRVLSWLRKVHGFSHHGVREALSPSLGLAPADIEILEYTNLWRDDLVAGPRDWWDSQGDVASVGGTTLSLPAFADGRWHLGRPTLLYHSIDGDPRDPEPALGADITVRIDKDFTASFANGNHAGLCIWNAQHELVWLGFTKQAGTTALATRLWTAAGPSPLQILANPAPATPAWLRLRFDGGASYTAWASQTGPEDVTLSIPIGGIGQPGFVGVTLFQDQPRNPSFADVRVSDWRAFFPGGLRVFNWYAYRDPALPGAPDMLGARAVTGKLKPAHTEASAVLVRAARADDPMSLCDDAPCA